MGGQACLIGNVARGERTQCRDRECPACKVSRALGGTLRSLYDHSELWQVEVNGLWIPVPMGHPYLPTEVAAGRAREVIDDCGPLTANLAAYVGKPEDDWYNPPHSCCVLFLPADAPAVADWTRVGRPPRPETENLSRLRLVVSNPPSEA